MNHQYPEVVGKHNNAERGYNDRGLKLTAFCTRNSLAITNTFFSHRRKYTWVSPDGKTLNTVDYILVRSKALPTVIDAHTVACLDISDHRLVRCKVKQFLYKPPMKKREPVYNVESLSDERTRKTYQDNIKQHLEGITSQASSSPNDLSNLLKETVKSCAESSLPKVSREHKHWITQDTLDSIESKNEIRKKLGKDSIMYKLHKSNVKKMCRTDLENSIEKDHKELNNLNPQQKYFRIMKKLKDGRKRKQTFWGIKDKDGIMLIDKVEILERWAAFYEELYYDAKDTTYFHTLETIPEILLEELKSILKMLKDRKAVGPDGINAELLKFGGPYLENLLLKMFNNIIRSNEFPKDFNLSEIVTIFKKGDAADCGNYRPISLLNHVYKILMQIIYKRIANTLSESLPSTQAAYQPARNTVEQIQSLQ